MTVRRAAHRRGGGVARPRPRSRAPKGSTTSSTARASRSRGSPWPASSSTSIPGASRSSGSPRSSFLSERAPAERSRIVSPALPPGRELLRPHRPGSTPPARARRRRRSATACRCCAPSCPPPTTIDRLTRYLEDRLAPRAVVHGVLLDIYGLGVLLLGRQRRGEERVRARPRRARPPPGLRRRRRDQAPRRPARGHGPRADALPHGAARGRASSTSRTSSASPRCA